MYKDLYLNRIAALDADQEDEERIQALIDEVEALDNLLSPEAQQLSQDLRKHTVTDDVYDELAEQASLGDRLADRLATAAGSWAFIGLFIAFMFVWMGINVGLGSSAWDKYPFILLNLGLSTLAALQAPVILMAQNRQSEKDRAVARNDFEVNIKSELEIANLHRKLDTLTNALDQQNRLINALVAARRREVNATIWAIEKERRQDNGPGGKSE